MSYKRRIGKIKVDFFNMRVEFSPNIEVLSKKSGSITGGSEIEEVTFSFEIMNNITPQTKPEYKAYSLSSNDLEDDEPFDLKNPWYALEGVELEIVKQAALPDSESAPATAPAPSYTPTPAPAPAPVTAPKPSSETLGKIAQIEKQIASLNDMIQNLDSSFSAGSVSQEEYIKKKNFLGEKMGALIGQLEALKS